MMWYTYTMEYYSATEKNEMMPLAATRTGLEMTASDGERRTSQAAAYRWNPHTEKSELGTSLVLQSLRIQLPMQGTRVQSPMGELRSHRPQGNRAYRPHLEKAHSLQRRPSTAKIESKSRGKFRFKGSKDRFHL